MRISTRRQWTFLALIAALALSGGALPDPGAALAQTAIDGPILSPRLGITFISSGQHLLDPARYQVALGTGAGWNRWPLYWHEVERSPGSYTWLGYDSVIRADLEHGLQVEAILMGRPNFRVEGASIAGLYEPIFADGTDNPRPGKPINPRNPWADFVARTVARYMPGGELGQTLFWPPERGIHVWEIWNEPDFSFFWNAPLEDYVRLLKIAYITIHHVDPQAQVMFGGLAYTNPETDDRFAQLLRLIAQDREHRRYNFYFDLVGVHSYSYAERTAFIVNWTRERLREIGAGSHPIWVNESGVSVWDDYPGPVWVDEPEERVLRATVDEQAEFVIQSAALAWAMGAEVVFHHQLYDDCGNQAQGTDFPPHEGELCVGDFQCWGDAFGLYRNTSDAACFSQHPQAGSPRSSALAYQLLARVFGRGTLAPIQASHVGQDGEITRLTFNRPDSGERIIVLWNRSGEPVETRVEAVSERASVYDMSGEEEIRWALNGGYALTLLPATNQNYPYLRPGDQYAIGGPPVILVEADPAQGAVTGTEEVGNPIDTTPEQAAAAPDNTPPIPAVQPLLPESPPTFDVAWGAEDASGIASFVVWVRVDGAPWQTWLETAQTSASYTGDAGRHYEFAVWAQDRAGNWSTNIDLTPMAATTVISVP